MADKENSAYAAAAAAAPRMTRASTKRAAAVTAVAVAAKRKRVALSEIPTLPNGAPQPHAKPKKPSSQVSNPKKRSISSLSQSLPAPKPATDAADETGDPQLCAPYASDIYSYLRSMEVQAKRRPAADYIERVQVDVTPNMRGILVDWLVEVAEEYKLVSDTLYLTVSYIDRFLSANSLNRQKLQLLGVSAMLIASKYEEISPPNVEDFCYITDNTYMKQELVKMERDILNNLKFEMGNPTAKTFLRMFIKSGQEEKKYPSLLLEFMGSYLTELSLLDYGCVRFLPSAVAASAVFVARLTLNPDSNPWSKKLQSVTGYSASELKDCITAIHDLQLSRKGQSWNAIRDKYKQHRFKGVSALLPPVGIPASYFEDLKE
ncbi:cyclin-A3-1-like [Triticum dicoccoides]|uniref:cyclin-A3-1-like n=1 Tax=Triticum dicoccoides TaxID=85692 RepID=UPI00188FAE97|nr:cyclin-A3-1-like [Triticum dicoccoides]